MSKPQFAILRFAKYKGPEISNIEAHNERTKEDCSNRNVNIGRRQSGRSKMSVAAPGQTVFGWWRHL